MCVMCVLVCVKIKVFTPFLYSYGFVLVFSDCANLDCPAILLFAHLQVIQRILLVCVYKYAM